MGSLKILVVVPARGGSKRIPKKNIVRLAGRPMIEWPLSVICEVFQKDDVVVSTDESSIIEVVENFGLNVPFIRPEYLSDDFVPTGPVVEHALDWYERENGKVDLVLTVYPTAVLFEVDDLRRAIESFCNRWQKIDALMSVTNFPFPIQRAMYIDGERSLRWFQSEHRSSRSQDLIEAVHDAGQFYIHKAEHIRAGRFLDVEVIAPFKLPRMKAVDIDNEEDLAVAEGIMKTRLGRFSS